MGTAFVTGATGCPGINLVGELLATGWRVVAMHVREVARAHAAAARLGHAGENYLLSGADATWVEVLGIIGELVGRPGPRRAMPPWMLRGIGWTMNLASHVTGREPAITPEGAEVLASEALFDCSKAVRELGYRPAPLREILEDVHRWMRAAGLLT